MKNLLIIILLIVEATFSISKTQAQTYGAGNLGGVGCTATGILGGCSNTYIGSAAGAAVTANNACNTFIGAFAGTSANASSSYNTFIGYYAGGANTTGTNNSFLGFGSGATNVSGSNNAFFGYASGYNNTASNNTFIGFDAGLYNTSGASNTFMGYSSGYTNTTGKDNTALGDSVLYSNTSGNYNSATGVGALFTNTTGGSNTAEGTGALYKNTTANSNSAFGTLALYTNSTGAKNTADGTHSLYNNTTGVGNTAIGYEALYSNTTGGIATSTGANVAVGYYALYSNTSGNYNTASGERSLYSNTTGTYNTAFGDNAGNANATCDHSTFIGYGADANGNYTNCSAIGNGAIATASDMVRVGNTTVSVIQGQVAWSTSDGRFKFNIQDNVKGLEFINKLHPITYQMNTLALDNFIIQNMPDSAKFLHQLGMNFGTSTAIIHSGFIAQAVDSAAQACGFVSSIVHTPANSTDPYALSYEEMVVPLVKAVQELSKKVDSLTAVSNVLCKSLINNDEEQDNTTSMHEIKLANNAVLYTNIPNPFDNSTTIKYFVPDNANAQIVFYDEFGTQMKIFNIEEKGIGQLKIDASNLSAGMYSYSLIVNGKVVDTKKMIKQ